MIAGGLDVNARGRGGADLLKWSLVHFCLECFETLLERGADIDRPPVGGYTGEFEQLLMKPVMELAASSWKDPRYLSLLLRHGGDPNALDVYGNRTILHIAPVFSGVEHARLLVEAGADIHARENLSLSTPLHTVVLADLYDTAYYLLEQGADPTLENETGSSVVDMIKRLNNPPHLGHRAVRLVPQGIGAAGAGSRSRDANARPRRCRRRCSPLVASACRSGRNRRPCDDPSAGGRFPRRSAFRWRGTGDGRDSGGAVPHGMRFRFGMS